MKEQDIKNMHIFWVQFESPKGTDGIIYFNHEYNCIYININKEFLGLELCKLDEVEFILEFEMKDIKKGNIIKIDKKDCKIIDFDLETNCEFNEFCDRCEQDELNFCLNG